MKVLRAAASIAVISLAGLAPVNAQEVGGRYQVQGENANGGNYSGVAEISGTAGGNCAIRWALVNTPPSQGFCMRQGDVVAAAYRLGNALGLVIYRLGEKGVLEGTWSVAGTEGVGEERLTPIR